MITPSAMKQIGLAVITFFFYSSIYAEAQPKFSIEPTNTTATTILLPVTSSATVQYQVTNKTKLTRTLTVVPITGMTHQTIGAGFCSNPFTLAPNQHCLLTLSFNGSQLARGGVRNGPQVCKTQGPGNNNPDLFLCSQPSQKNSLNISITNAEIKASVSSLTLSVNNTGLNAALTGKPRQITLTNIGQSPAQNVTYQLSSSLPVGTTITPAYCGTILPTGKCILTITPSALPTAAPGDLNPTAISLQAAGSNTNTVTSTLAILTYGSVYQSGYVFAINDTTPNTGSIAGKVVALQNQSNSIYWGPEVITVEGIGEQSTAGPNSCKGNADGACNTLRIINRLTNTNPPALPLNTYAAGLCKAKIGNYSDWYLPAICEMGYDTSNTGSLCGTQAAPLLQNMKSNLVDNNNIGALTGFFWSSTELTVDPAPFAWFEAFDSSTCGGDQCVSGKNNLENVRCTRIMTN
ncbi:MAG: hypothetical protein P4L65_04815 [Legionella sp.]|nr:hypothetical protein [Legionella sp.]